MSWTESYTVTNDEEPRMQSYEHHFIIPGKIDEQTTIDQAQQKSANDTRTHVVHYHRGEEECLTRYPHKVYVGGHETAAFDRVTILPRIYRSTVTEAKPPMSV